MISQNARNRVLSFGIAIVVTAVFLRLLSTSFYQTLEVKTLDFRFLLRGSRPATAPVVHVDVDDATLAKLGRWPLPRGFHAQVIDVLSECGAAQILLDIFFVERSGDDGSQDRLLVEAAQRAGNVYIPFFFSKVTYEIPEGLRRLLQEDITLSREEAAEALGPNISLTQEAFSYAKRVVADELLKGVIAQRSSLHDVTVPVDQIAQERGWFLFPEDEAYLQTRLQLCRLSLHAASRFAFELPRKSERDFLPNYTTFTFPLEDFIPVLKGSGYVNADPDSDGVVRRVRLFVRDSQLVFPHLIVAALRDFTSQKLEYLSKKEVLFQGNTFSKQIRIPLTNEGNVLVNWVGKWGEDFVHIPYARLLQLSQIQKELAASDVQENTYLRQRVTELKREISELVKGKICIVGLTATGTQDIQPMPFQTDYPIVGLQSNLLDTLMSGKFIKRPSLYVTFALFLLSAVVVSMSGTLRMGRSVLLSLLYIVLYCLLAQWSFVARGWWVDVTGPLGIVFFSFLGITTVRYCTEEREKRLIKHAFSHYLSPEVINLLLKDPSQLKLSGQRRELTVLFADIRGFTKFSESRSPEEVCSVLNQYFTEAVEVIFQYHGTFDKFVGDQIMAFFGAPGDLHKDDHAVAAVRSAIEIQKKLSQLRDRLFPEGKDALRIGIGISTGEMVVGNMGSLRRMDYTVIGDNVNLGARLCSAAAADEIIINQKAYIQVRDVIQTETLKPIMVKGKSEPLAIYRIHKRGD